MGTEELPPAVNAGDQVSGARAPPGRGGSPISFGARLRVLIPGEACAEGEGGV